MIVRLVPALLVLALSPGPTSVAGVSGPTWTSSPTQGPSPNTIQVSGNGCYFPVEAGGAASGVSVLGGENGLVYYGEAVVQLRDKDNPATVLEEEEYAAGREESNLGEWQGPFPIPAGLEPGTYPLKARCNPILLIGGYGLSLAQGAEGFDYPDRSYTVVAQSDPGDPVEAEVTFTG